MASLNHTFEKFAFLCHRLKPESNWSLIKTVWNVNMSKSFKTKMCV